MNVDTSLLATIIYNATKTIGANGSDADGNQRWEVVLHGIPLHVAFKNPTDRWTIGGAAWAATFLFTPAMPLAMEASEDHPTWFGLWGSMSEAQIAGDPQAFVRDITLLKVSLESIPDPKHTSWDFQEARIGP